MSSATVVRAKSRAKMAVDIEHPSYLSLFIKGRWDAAGRRCAIACQRVPDSAGRVVKARAERRPA